MSDKMAEPEKTWCVIRMSGVQSTRIIQVSVEKTTTFFYCLNYITKRYNYPVLQKQEISMQTFTAVIERTTERKAWSRPTAAWRCRSMPRPGPQQLEPML